MTKEDKDLLLRDLCARLPYDVKIERALYGAVDLNERHIESFTKGYDDILMPYLRPLSSMTEEEQKILDDFGITISPISGQIQVPFNDIQFPFTTMQKIISYLYSIHIDINGLIEKGLAIKTSRDNNPYKEIVL